MTPEHLADLILQAAGSGLRHYTEYSKERILKVAAEAIEAIKNDR